MTVYLPQAIAVSDVAFLEYLISSLALRYTGKNFDLPWVIICITFQSERHWWMNSGVRCSIFLRLWEEPKCYEFWQMNKCIYRRTIKNSIILSFTSITCTRGIYTLLCNIHIANKNIASRDVIFLYLGCTQVVLTAWCVAVRTGGARSSLAVWVGRHVDVTGGPIVTEDDVSCVWFPASDGRVTFPDATT